MGHGRGVRPRTYKGQCPSGRPENQSKIVLLLGFYRQTRLTTFGLFAVFPWKMCEKLKPAGRGHQLSLQNSRFSTRKRGESGNNEIIGTAWWACAIWGCSWGPPGARLGGFRGPPEGVPEPPGVPKYAIFQLFYMCL